MMQDYNKQFHCIYKLNYHLVIATKYRKKCINKEMLTELNSIISTLLLKNEGKLIEFNGEEEHLHLLFELPPKITLSNFVNNLKTVSSRLIRKKFKNELEKYYKQPVLWSRSYFVTSCGGAPLSVIKQYIEQQEEIV